MQPNEVHDDIASRQFDFMQRIGRIGYWEFDSLQHPIELPLTSRQLLQAMLGTGEQLPRSFMEALPTKERQRFQTTLEQACAQGLTLAIELEMRRADGQSAYVMLRGAPLALAGSARRFAGTFQEITREKQRDAEHEKMITQLQALLDALPQGVSVIDQNLGLLLWNRRFYEILGFPQQMVVRGAQFDDFIRFNALRGDYGPGDPEQQVQTIVARARQFLPHCFERQLSGGRTVRVEGFPFKSGGAVSGFVTTYTDITEQKLTEEQLTRQRDVMKTVIDNFPGGISLCNSDLRFTAYNEQMMELLDFPPALFTKGWVDFEDLVRFNVKRGEYGAGDPEQQVQAAIERAKNFQAHRMERARPNGRWLEIRGTPIPSGGFVSSYIDITERKRIEAELVHAKETAEARREQLASLLDHSGQGFLSFGSDLRVEAEYSRACEAMLGQNPAGQDAAQVLFSQHSHHASLLRETVAAVANESDADLCQIMLSLLPAEFARGALLLKAEYKLIENKRLMVVLTDISGERQLETRLEAERRHLEMIVAAVTESRDFFDTVQAFQTFAGEGLDQLVGADAAPSLIVKELYRQVHTFKGLLNQFSFDQTPLALHALESQLEDLRQAGPDVSPQQLGEVALMWPLAALLEADLNILRDALGAEFVDSGNRIVISVGQAQQLQRLADQLLRGEAVDASVEALRQQLQEISHLRWVRLADALSSFDRLIKQAASRLEKEVGPLEVQCGTEVWIDPEIYHPFLRSLTHIFRNAVVHGIEDPQTRLELGKPAAGCISCQIEVKDSRLLLCIADDGAGINLAALRERAGALMGLAEETRLEETDLVDLIFLDHISTLQTADALAGRGVGLAAVRSEARKLKGDVVVRSVAGRGTEFLFTLPLHSDLFDRENIL